MSRNESNMWMRSWEGMLHILCGWKGIIQICRWGYEREYTNMWIMLWSGIYKYDEDSYYYVDKAMLWDDTYICGWNYDNE